MNKAEKYDIKEASNPSLTKSARKNYADNAQHNVKKYDGPKMTPEVMAAKMAMDKVSEKKKKKNKAGKAIGTAAQSFSDSIDKGGDKLSDLLSGISMRGTSMGCGVNMKSGCQVSKHMGGPKMKADLKYMPIDNRASGK